MACWTGFAPIIDTMVSDYNPDDLRVATLRAALELGVYLGGYSDTWTGPAEPYTETATPCSAPKVSVAPPILPGWELVGIVRVSVNGQDIPPEGQVYAHTCMRWKTLACGRVVVSNVWSTGISPTVELEFTVNLVPGQAPAEMPDFLLSRYSVPMQYAIAAILTSDDIRRSSQYYKQYLVEARRAKVRKGAAVGMVGGRI